MRRSRTFSIWPDVSPFFHSDWRLRDQKCARPVSRVSWSAFAFMCATISNSPLRSEEHTSELQSLMRISYAVFCLKKKTILRVHCMSHQTHTRSNPQIPSCTHTEKDHASHTDSKH